MNKIILVGRLTKDPEVRSTSAGFSTVNFTVAVNRNFKNKDGNYDADFLPCVAFVGGKNDASSSTSNSAYVDAPSAAPIDEMPEYDIPASDPYENYDKEVSLSDNDLPF